MSSIDIPGPVPFGSSVVFVASADGLPEPSMGVITLDGTKSYMILSQIDVGTNQINPNGATLAGVGRGTCGLTTANADGLIKTTGSLEIKDLTLVNSTGPCFNLTGAPNAFHRLRDCNIANGARGLVTGAAGFRGFLATGCTWTSLSLSALGYSGIGFVGNFDTIGFIVCGFLNLLVPTAVPEPRLVELLPGVTVGIFTFTNSSIAPAEGQTGFYADPNTVILRGAGLTLSDFGLLGTPVGGWTRATKRVTFLGNQKLQNSTYTGLITLGGNGAQTTFPGTGPADWVRIAIDVAWVEDPTNERFEQSGANGDELEMIGVSPHRVGVDATVVLESTVAAAKDFEIRIRQWDASATTTITVGQPTPVAYRQVPATGVINFFADVEEGDLIWAEVRAVTDTTNAIIRSASVRLLSSS